MKINRKRFLLTTVLPTLLTIGIFILLIFRFIIPYFEQNMLNQKKEMLRELLNSALSIAETYHREALSGLMGAEQARAAAIEQISNIRYGIANKDYFWITDALPRMIVHPYRPDLNGTDLREFTDPSGKKMFLEMVQVVKESGSGYVDYKWQWMDDDSRIVSKISFVRQFEPWGWIIGTGIYIQDVHEEISSIKKKLLMVLLLISFAVALLLAFIVRQNLKTEISRKRTELELLDSRERYKALVEASSEGTWMILEGTTIFANRKFLEILPGFDFYSQAVDLWQIVSPECRDDIERVKDFFSGDETFLRLETRIQPPGKPSCSIIMSVSRITLSEKNGYIVILKELGCLQEKNTLADLAEMFDLGYFQASPGKNGRIIRISRSALAGLGFESESELLNLRIAELLAKPRAWLTLLRKLDEQGSIVRYPLLIKSRGNELRTIRVSARIVRDDQGVVLYSEGFLEEISEDVELRRAREELLEKAQSLLLNLSRPLGQVMQDIVHCPGRADLRQAAKLMQAHAVDHLLVIDDQLEASGMLTRDEIIRSVFLAGADPEQKVSSVMIAPQASGPEDLALIQAWQEMGRKKAEQLLVVDHRGRPRGTVTSRKLAELIIQTGTTILPGAEPVLELAELRSMVLQLPDLIEPLVRNRCLSSASTGIITRISDQAVLSVVSLLEMELGPPPAPYALVVLGSLARKEPTLLSDQDNALVYSDPVPDRSQFCRDYFQRFGERLNLLLAELGFPLCPGGLMAGNPRWNQPLSKWKEYFTKWITEPETKNIMDTVTFFDLRAVCGDLNLVEELKNHATSLLRIHPMLCSLLSRECLQYRTPLGLFGKIQTEEDEAHGNRLNLKNPLRIIVNLVRLYSMVNGVPESNSLRRLQLLKEAGVVPGRLRRGIEQAFDYLTLLQLSSQIRTVKQRETMTSFVDLDDMSEIEISTIKVIFNEINAFQARLKHDFSILE